MIELAALAGLAALKSINKSFEDERTSKERRRVMARIEPIKEEVRLEAEAAAQMPLSIDRVEYSGGRVYLIGETDEGFAVISGKLTDKGFHARYRVGRDAPTFDANGVPVGYDAVGGKLFTC